MRAAVRVESPKAVHLSIDSKPGMSAALTVESQSGRARVLTLDEADKEQSKAGRLIFYPLPPGNERGRSLALGDIDGDGKVDVVVTDPPTSVRAPSTRRSERARVDQSFPGLVGGKTVAVHCQRRSPMRVMCSEQEKQVGLSRFENGRLSFPTPLPISGDQSPSTCATSILQGR